MQFYIENKIVRRRSAPSLDCSDVGHRVKSGIDLHHLKMLRVPAESLVRRHFLWIPTLDESRIGPACRSDQDSIAPGFCGFTHALTKPPRQRTQIRSARASYLKRLSSQ